MPRARGALWFKGLISLIIRWSYCSLHHTGSTTSSFCSLSASMAPCWFMNIHLVWTLSLSRWGYTSRRRGWCDYFSLYYRVPPRSEFYWRTGAMAGRVQMNEWMNFSLFHCVFVISRFFQRVLISPCSLKMGSFKRENLIAQAFVFYIHIFWENTPK